MSQCSYVNVRIVSEKIAEWLEPFLEEIEEAKVDYGMFWLYLQSKT